ncbi:flagellar hook-associated protein 2 [Sporolactobacillus sp. STCC-11]|uniref:flagellar hook-associated protein 2 n=1 Tax=Sporolactobacillus caesalpiniae TaxID=3230362 RepID=UPI003390DEBF
MADSSSSSVSIDSINSMIGATNTNRVSGLASGIDVDSIVAKLMTAESQPLVQMQQNLQLTEWQRDDYRSMNTLLSNLQSVTQNMKLQGTYMKKNATSSNSSIVTATAGATAGNASNMISVTQLATSAYNVGGEITSEDDSFDADASLSSQAPKLSGSIDETISFTISTYNTSGNKIDKEFDFPSSMSLNSILSAISSSGIGVNAYYDSATRTVSMTRTDTGDLSGSATEGHAIYFNGSAFLTDTLKLSQSGETLGKDAEFTLNGLSTHRSTNTFTLGGVTYTLQGVGSNTRVQVNNDTDTVYNSIADFVSKYNDTIKQINDKISEKRNRDYAPLTDAQKSTMKDSDITSWTDKAKSGMLANDSILSGALSQLRTNLYTPVNGTSNTNMDQLAEIGITTSSDYLDHGKLIIDEDKLKQAISTNPQAVMELFTKTGDTTSEQGIMQRLNTTLKNTMDQIEDKAGNTNMVYTQYSMGKSIDDMNDRIDAFKLRLQDIQTRYYTQFDAMEAAIQQANSQASYLSQFTSS